MLQKAKEDYFKSLDKKYITENKCPWKTVSPVLPNKVQSFERIKLAEEDNAQLTNEEEVALNLSNYFSNSVINVKILKFENFDSFSENILHQTILL